MAKPLPSVKITPTASASSLSYAKLRALWIQAGGDPNLASTMAAIALAESGGKVGALNDNPKSGDYSVGLWQINYFGDMRKSRTAAFGSPTKLQTDPLANARAAVALAAGGSGLSNWTTFTSGAYSAFFKAQTPQEKVANDTALANAKAGSPAYIQATTDLSIIRSEARAQAEEQSHVSEIKAYQDDYLAYTGRQASSSQIQTLLNRGVSLFTLRNELATLPTFKQSPIYLANGPGIAQQVTAALGAKKPPAGFVEKAIAQGWDSATLKANIMALPGYKNGPEFKQNFTNATTVYKDIYGAPGKLQNEWLKSHVLQGWTPDEVAAKLRSDPAYKYSPEYRDKVLGVLDALSPILGVSPTIAPAAKIAVKQATKGSVLGPLPNPFKVSEGTAQ